MSEGDEIEEEWGVLISTLVLNMREELMQIVFFIRL